MRSDRLLRAMHKVYSHDLPNQIVVLQSLLQLLQLDEAERLSPDGQDYLRRLQNVTQRTTQMVRFLKEMEKLSNYVGKPEELSLSLLAREIQGVLKQQFPLQKFTFTWQWDVPTVVVDFRTMLLALTEILTWATATRGDACQVRGTSAAGKKQIALHFVLESTNANGDNLSAPASERGTQPSADQRMEIILARECLAVSQATLELPAPDAAGVRFTILVPN